MKKLMFVASVAVTAFLSSAETYKLKYVTTVDIVEDGKVVGSRKLNAGTLIQDVRSSAVDGISGEVSGSSAKQTTRNKLRLSKLSPVMFKTTRQAVAHSFNVRLTLADYYKGPFDGKNDLYWNVDVYAFNSSWDGLEILCGYVKKNSPAGRQVLRDLSDGAEHYCRARLKLVRTPDYDDIVLIEDFELTDKPDL